MARYPEAELAFETDDAVIRIELRSVAAGGQEAVFRGDPIPRVNHAVAPAESNLALLAAVQQELRRSLGEPLDALARTAEREGPPLRLRLLLPRDDVHFLELPWERLSPFTGRPPVCEDARVLFARTLNALDWRQIPAKDLAEVRVVEVVAHPSDWDVYRPGGRPMRLEPPPQAAWSSQWQGPRAQQQRLTSEGEAHPTPDNLQSAIAAGLDLLYLCSPCSMIDGEPWFWLEDELGETSFVAGKELAEWIESAAVPPALIFIDCFPTATSDSEIELDPEAAGRAMRRLGAELVVAGAGAALVYGGPLDPGCRSALLRDLATGLWQGDDLDTATARARTLLPVAQRDRLVLACRLKSLRLPWDRRGQLLRRRMLAVQSEESEAAGTAEWSRLSDQIRNQQSVPVIGWELEPGAEGSASQLANRWAEKLGLPLAQSDRGDLARVAQKIELAYGRSLLEEELRTAVRANGGRERTIESRDPLATLAACPFPLYVTTRPDDGLQEQLRRQGKIPRTWWYGSKIRDQDDGVNPTPERPLVYHLFGHVDDPDSLVISEDDFVQFLLEITQRADSLPFAVRRALGWSQEPIFLGFRLDEWPFRALISSIYYLFDRLLQQRERPAVLQVHPGEDPEAVLQWMRCRSNWSDVRTYWGTPADFLAKLQDRGHGSTWEHTRAERVI